MAFIVWLCAFIAGALALAYLSIPGWAWAAGIAAMLVVGGLFKIIPAVALIPMLAVLALIAVSLLIPVVRRRLFSAPIFAFYKKILPPMSDTERDALEAGTTWWDGQLFSGKPAWDDLLRTPPPMLTAEEQSFLDTETEQLCAMIDEWQVIDQLHDLSPEAWRFIKEKG